MSYPNVIFGDYGDEKVTATAKIGGLPFGQLMILPDGRKFRHARAGATAVVPGKLYDGPAIVADHGCGTADGLVVTSAPLNAIAVSLSAGGTTAVTKDQYAGGFLFIRDDAGEGRMYKVKGNASAGTVIVFKVDLEPSDPIALAVSAVTTTAGLRKSPYDSIVIKTANTVSVGPIVGVPAASCAASAYLWVQKSGEASVLADGTLIIGRAVVASSAVAGAVAAAPADTSTITNAGRVDVLGDVVVVSADTEYAVINLRLE